MLAHREPRISTRRSWQPLEWAAARRPPGTWNASRCHRAASTCWASPYSLLNKEIINISTNARNLLICWNWNISAANCICGLVRTRICSVLRPSRRNRLISTSREPPPPFPFSRLFSAFSSDASTCCCANFFICCLVMLLASLRVRVPYSTVRWSIKITHLYFWCQENCENNYLKNFLNSGS